MKVNFTRQGWSLIGQQNKSSYQGQGRLATISNDSTSGFPVKIFKNGDYVTLVQPGQSKTFSTTPGDILEVHSGSKRINQTSASGQILA